MAILYWEVIESQSLFCNRWSGPKLKVECSKEMLVPLFGCLHLVLTFVNWINWSTKPFRRSEESVLGPDHVFTSESQLKVNCKKKKNLGWSAKTVGWANQTFILQLAFQHTIHFQLQFTLRPLMLFLPGQAVAWLPSTILHSRRFYA